MNRGILPCLSPGPLAERNSVEMMVGIDTGLHVCSTYR